MKMNLKKLVLLGAVIVSLPSLSNAQDLPSYVPHPVTVPDGASYLTLDREVQIVGNDGWDVIIDQFNALFLKTHPAFGRTFHTVLKGSSVAIPGLEMGVSAFAPMGRAMWETDRASFHRFHGYDPLDIHVGYDAFGPRSTGKTPPGIYVNVSNPLAGLTVEQVKRTLTVGSDRGDVSQWGQLGLTGKWAHRIIHIYGLDPSGGGATSFRMEYLGGLPFAPTYEKLDSQAEVLRALAEDPYGIALLGYVDTASVSERVRMLPVAARDGAPFLLPSYDVVRAGRYAFPAYLHVYVNREPGKPLDPFVKEYLRMVLSREGQAILAEQKDSEEGYVPLAPELIAAQMKMIE
jgi:phosphate transport system substrate-binding protein